MNIIAINLCSHLKITIKYGMFRSIRLNNKFKCVVQILIRRTKES